MWGEWGRDDQAATGGSNEGSAIVRESTAAPSSPRATGDGAATDATVSSSAADRDLRRRQARDAVAEEVGAQRAFESAVLETHAATGPRAATPEPTSGSADHATPPPTSTTTAPDRPRTTVLRGLVLVLLGGYAVWAPMLELTWTQAQILYGAALGLGVLALAHGSWRRIALLPLGLFLANWAVLWATHAHWAAWDTTYSRAVQETYALRACGLNGVGVVLVCGAGRFGARAVRGLWVLLGASLLVMALAEVFTGTHFSPGGPYAPPAFSPSGPFGNPNNLACVLVVVLGVVLGRMSERLPTWHRAVLSVAAGVTVGLVVLTLSRAAVAACAVMGLAGGVLALSRSPRGRRLLHLRGLRGWARAALVTLAVAPVVLAAVALWRLVAPGHADQVRSDGLRLTLVRLALDYWRTSPWLGVGGGRFEMLLRDEHPEIGYVLPVHNTFVEFLTEYGVVGAGSLAALLLLAAVVIALPTGRTTPGTTTTPDPTRPNGATAATAALVVSGRPRTLDDAGARHLAFVLLLGIVLAGTVTSSALNWQVWWLMISSLTVLTGHLLARRYDARATT